MFVRRSGTGDVDVRLNRENLPRLLVIGLAAGSLSGFFGIGGGFLIVPGLMFATAGCRSSMRSAPRWSRSPHSARRRRLNYAVSGFVDWRLAIVFIVGGIVGGLIGGRIAKTLGERRGALNTIFAGVVFVVAIYMLIRSFAA